MNGKWRACPQLPLYLQLDPAVRIPEVFMRDGTCNHLKLMSSKQVRQTLGASLGPLWTMAGMQKTII